MAQADNRTKLDGEITTPEQHQTFKEMLLRLLDDPQIQQKIGAFPPTLRIGALWVYGAAAPDGSRWYIAGNLMEPEPHSAWLFDYPV
jgi:hypothetical protein